MKDNEFPPKDERSMSSLPIFLPRFPAAPSRQDIDAMRGWVRFTLSDVTPYPGEHEARVVCEHYGIMELQRPMTTTEHRLMMEAVRDVLTGWYLERDLKAMQDKKAQLADTQERLHRPGSLWSRAS